MSQQIDSSSILRLKAVRALTGLSRSTLWRLWRRGEFPQPLKLTARLIGWRAAEVQRWLDSRERGCPALAEAKTEMAEVQRRENPRARRQRSPQVGDSASSGLREHGTTQGAERALHKVSSARDAAGIGTEGSCETKGAAR
jgi:prophage regulatory protein